MRRLTLTAATRLGYRAVRGSGHPNQSNRTEHAIGEGIIAAGHFFKGLFEISIELSKTNHGRQVLKGTGVATVLLTLYVFYIFGNNQHLHEEKARLNREIAGMRNAVSNAEKNARDIHKTLREKHEKELAALKNTYQFELSHLNVEIEHSQSLIKKMEWLFQKAYAKVASTSDNGKKISILQNAINAAKKLEETYHGGKEQRLEERKRCETFLGWLAVSIKNNLAFTLSIVLPVMCIIFSKDPKMVSFRAGLFNPPSGDDKRDSKMSRQQTPKAA